MTAIVGIVDGSRVWLGGDSRLSVSEGGTYETTLTPKVWRAGGYLVGEAGNSAWSAVLRRVALPAVASAGYMASGWVEDLIASARALGLEFPAEEGALDGSALIAGAGFLWYVDSALDCYRVPGEIAIGSGGAAARGALAVMRGPAKRRVLRALEASASVCAEVGPPFTIIAV